MKNLINIFVFLLIVFVSNAQSFTFKTNEKVFTDEIGTERTVTGIRAKIVSNIDCNLSDSTFSRTFYIEFVLATGTVFGQRNASTDEFVVKMVGLGMSESSARNAVEAICKGLEYGTKQEKYAAAQQLAGSYGYTLKPLVEQEEE
jgi:hypothetical protein